MLRRVIAIAAAFTLAAVTGCDGCADPLAPVGGTTPLTPDGTLAAKEPRQIVFDGTSPVIVYRGTTTTLRFVVSGERTGTPVRDATVTVDSTGFGATVQGATFTTDATGAALIPVRTEAFDGELTVTARTTDIDGGLEEATARLLIVEDPAATLQIAVASTTRIPVVSATALAYVATGAPSCALLLAQSSPPTPSFTGSYASVPGTRAFPDQATGRRATALVLGFGANGAVIARGCAETDRLTGGAVTTLTVTLIQGGPVLTGDYDVLMHVALGDALPSPYDTTIDNITAVLSDPAGMALFFVMRAAGVEFNANNTYRDAERTPTAFPFWNSFRTALDGVLTQRLGQRYTDVTNVGAGIRDVITDFEIGGRFVLTEPLDGSYEIHEAWRDAVVYWPLPCANGDMACARRPISLNNLSLTPVDATYAATITDAPVGTNTERWSVTTAPHGFNLNYGNFVLAILNQVVFPSLPNGLAADSLGGVLNNVVRCQDIATSISGGSPVVQSLINGVCTGGLNAAATFAEAQLTALRVNAANPGLGQEGLAAEGSFILNDANKDTDVETIADFLFNIGWNYPNDPNASQDISSPIFGDGVRARAACVDDGQCSGAQACAPIASYLKVARVGFGCQPLRGALAGGASCSTDAQCGSGICDPTGLGGATICYEACDAPSDCSVGLTCSDIGGLVDLDVGLAGLGDMLISGCAAP